MSANILRASKLARIMSCVGSIQFQLPPEETNEAAKQGTACAEYLERLIKGQPIGTHASNGVPFDQDMAFYSHAIFEDIKTRASGPIQSELKVAFDTTAGVRIQGSFDVSYVDAEGRLHVEDLKYGWRIVEPEMNWQLIAYAIGASQGHMFREIVLTIQQPRPHHEKGSRRSWTITGAELAKYRAQIEDVADRLMQGDKTLQTGEHCRYCRAAPVCPAFNRSFYAGVEYAHEFVQDEISDEQLAQQMDFVQRVADIIKIKQDSLRELTIHRLKEGRLIPNYGIEPKYGDRVWKPSVTPMALEMMTGKKVTETRLLSPAKIEKLGVSRELVAALVERPFTGQNLVKRDSGELGDKIFGTEMPTKGIT